MVMQSNLSALKAVERFIEKFEVGGDDSPLSSTSLSPASPAPHRLMSFSLASQLLLPSVFCPSPSRVVLLSYPSFLFLQPPNLFLDIFISFSSSPHSPHNISFLSPAPLLLLDDNVVPPSSSFLLP